MMFELWLPAVVEGGAQASGSATAAVNSDEIRIILPPSARKPVRMRASPALHVSKYRQKKRYGAIGVSVPLLPDVSGAAGRFPASDCSTPFPAAGLRVARWKVKSRVGRRCPGSER